MFSCLSWRAAYHVVRKTRANTPTALRRRLAQGKRKGKCSNCSLDARPRWMSQAKSVASGRPNSRVRPPVEEALKPQHAVEFSLRHAHRAEHGQLPPPQLNIGGNGVEHIGCGDQEEEQNKDIGEHVHHEGGVLELGRRLIQVVHGILAGKARLLQDGLQFRHGLGGGWQSGR